MTDWINEKRNEMLHLLDEKKQEEKEEQGVWDERMHVLEEKVQYSGRKWRSNAK